MKAAIWLGPIATVLFALLAGRGCASEISDAMALRQEAMDVFRQSVGGNPDPTLYAEALKKLEKAEELLEAAKKTDPEKAEAMLSEISSARFWAQKFATIQVADALKGEKRPPATDDKKPPAPPAQPSNAAAAAAPDAKVSPSEELKREAAQLRRDGKFAEANAKLKEYLALLDKSMGPDNPDVISTEAKLRDYFFDDGNYVVAAAYAK